MPGLVIDDVQAIKKGKWAEGQGLKGYIGYHYLYTAANSDAEIRFEFKPTKPGRYEVRLAYQPHENRGTSVPVTVISADGSSDWGQGSGPDARGDHWYQRMYACRDTWLFVGAHPSRAARLAEAVVGRPEVDESELEDAFLELTA